MSLFEKNSVLDWLEEQASAEIPERYFKFDDPDHYPPAGDRKVIGELSAECRRLLGVMHFIEDGVTESAIAHVKTHVGLGKRGEDCKKTALEAINASNAAVLLSDLVATTLDREFRAKLEDGKNLSIFEGGVICEVDPPRRERIGILGLDIGGTGKGRIEGLAGLEILAGLLDNAFPDVR